MEGCVERCVNSAGDCFTRSVSSVCVFVVALAVCMYCMFSACSMHKCAACQFWLASPAFALDPLPD